MNRIARSAFVFCVLWAASACGQSNPGFYPGQQYPPLTQFNSYFSAKTDVNGGAMIGGRITGGNATNLNLTTPAVTAGTGELFVGWPTAGRPQCSAGVLGYNTTLNSIEWCNGVSWVQPITGSFTNLSISGNLSVGGTSQFTGAITASSLALTGNLSVGGTSQFTGAVTDASNLGVAGGLTVGGTSQFNGYVNALVNTTIQNQQPYTFTQNISSPQSGPGAAWTFLVTTNVTGAPNIAGNALQSELHLAASHGTDFSGPGASEWSAIVGSVHKDIPTGGFSSLGGQEGWAFYNPFYDNTNLVSSIAGSDNLDEGDMFVNNLDTTPSRHGWQIIFPQGHPTVSNGYSPSVSNGLLMFCGTGSSGGAESPWCHDMTQLVGGYIISAIDLRNASTSEPRITSATPSGSVYSVTVDDVMPIAAGGTNFGSYVIGIASTAAITGITAVSAGGTTLNISSTGGQPAGQSGPLDYVTTGMYVYDATNPLRIPSNTTISSMSGTSLVLSASTTVVGGDAIVFSRALQPVSINGHSYMVEAITLPVQNNTGGAVYFQSAVTAADAANGNSILPASHTIWMQEGSVGGPSFPLIPASDISFNRAGTATLGCQDSNCLELSMQRTGLVIQSITNGWGNQNWGKQLLISPPPGGGANPAIAITDNAGNNYWGISNGGGTLSFAMMPPWTDNSTTPVVELSLGPTAIVIGGNSHLPVMINNLPTSCSGQASFTIWSNSGVLSICP